MKRTRWKILKEIITRGLEFNSKSISETFFQMGIVFFGALLGGLASINLSKNLTSVKAWLILVIILFGVAFFFNIVKLRELFRSLFKEFIQSSWN